MDWSGVMPYRHSELVAFGPGLCEEAKRSGKGVNESYLLVHRLLAEAFREDLAEVPKGSLGEHLSGRLQKSLHSQA